MNFLAEIGYPLTRMEEAGITYTVKLINCEYGKTTTFSDEIEIHVEHYRVHRGQIKFSYTMWNKESGEAWQSLIHSLLPK